MVKAVRSNAEKLIFRDCSKALRIIGDQTRMQILRLLLLGELSVLEIADALDLGQPKVSHHLAILRNNNFVEDQRIGKSVIYSIHSSLKVPTKADLDLGCCKLQFKKRDICMPFHYDRNK
jgi:DNA-binding transcriptional ArsR family regulator